MSAFRNAVEAHELAELTRTWGEFPREHHQLTVDHPFLSGEHQLLTSDRRRAEICYVMHRGDPAEGVLLHVKTYYPTGAYRLPTGGIHWGETVTDTLEREILEETGLTVGAAENGVVVERFLGMLSYEMAHRGQGKTHTFATYHFLTRMPPEATLNPLDPEESILDWRWCTPAELAEVADTLESVHRRESAWADWGRYRSLSQRFVGQALVGG